MEVEIITAHTSAHLQDCINERIKEMNFMRDTIDVQYVSPFQRIEKDETETIIFFAMIKYRPPHYFD